jgi:heterodisulfide reductase subunit A
MENIGKIPMIIWIRILGDFTATINKKAEYVIPYKCIGCHEDLAPCPLEVPNEYDDFPGKRKAIHFQVIDAIPIYSTFWIIPAFWL